MATMDKKQRNESRQSRQGSPSGGSPSGSGPNITTEDVERHLHDEVVNSIIDDPVFQADVGYELTHDKQRVIVLGDPPDARRLRRQDRIGMGIVALIIVVIATLIILAATQLGGD